MLSATFYASIILFFTSMNCFPSEDIQTKNPLTPKLVTQSQPPSAQNAQTVAKPSPKPKKTTDPSKNEPFYPSQEWADFLCAALACGAL